MDAIATDGQGEAANSGCISLVLEVEPVVGIAILVIRRSLDLKNVITDTDSGGVDVTPEADHLGTDLHIQADSIGKKGIFGENHVTLTVELEVLVLPSLEMRISVGSRDLASGTTTGRDLFYLSIVMKEGTNNDC